MKIIQCQHNPRSASGSRSSRNQCPLGTDHEGCDGSENNPVPTQPTFSQGSRSSRNQCPLGIDHEAPAYSQGVLPCPLALSARHFAHAPGPVNEAPTFSQWVPAFSQSHVILALTTRHPMLDNCKRSDFSNDHMVLSTVWPLEWRCQDCLKARHKRVLNEINGGVLLTITKDVQGRRFRTRPWYSGRRCRTHPQTTKKSQGAHHPLIKSLRRT